MDYPKSEDKKIQKLSNLLTKYAEQEGVEFCFGGNLIYSLETFAHFGCLSLFLFEAQDIYEKTYNNLFTVSELFDGLGHKVKPITSEDEIKEQNFLDQKNKTIKFPIEYIDQDEGSYFGFVPRLIKDETVDFFKLAHFAHYSVEEYIKIYKKNKMLLVEGKIPLDPLFDKMMTKIKAQKVVIKPAIKSNISNN